MTPPTTPKPKIWAVLLVSFLVLAGLGLIGLGTQTFLTIFIPMVQKIGILKYFYDTIVAVFNYVKEHFAESVVAIATILLWKSTDRLCKSSESSERAAMLTHKLQGPFIALDFATSDAIKKAQTPENSQVALPAYDQTYAKDDAHHTRIQNSLAEDEINYICAIIRNTSTSHMGHAINLQIDALLAIEQGIGSEPLLIPRTIFLNVLLPGFIVVKLYNVTGIAGYSVSVTSLRYYDILGSVKEASIGHLLMAKTVDKSEPDSWVLVRQPRLGEFTDGIK